MFFGQRDVKAVSKSSWGDLLEARFLLADKLVLVFDGSNRVANHRDFHGPGVNSIS